MAKTLVDVDDNLLEAAQRVLGTATKAETIRQALRQVAAASAYDGLLNDLASLDAEQRAALEGARDQW